MVKEIAGVLLGIGGALYTNARQAREAEKNRKFQKEMSDTAHQREVEDLRRAGLHPMLSAHGGASTPSGSQAQMRDPGEGGARGLASALAIQRQKAEIALLQSQAEREKSTAGLTNVQRMAIQGKTPLEMALLEGQIAVTDLSAAEKKAVLPTLFKQAEAELSLTMSSAKAMKLLAELRELDKAGAENISKFEKEIGTKGPAMRLLLEVLRSASSWRDRR